MTKRVLVFGSSDWAETLTRPITSAFYNLWPATHTLYCDMSSNAGRIAYDKAVRLGFKHYQLEKRHLNAEFDLALEFRWDSDKTKPPAKLRSEARIVYITRRRPPREPAPAPET